MTRRWSRPILGAVVFLVPAGLLLIPAGSAAQPEGPLDVDEAVRIALRQNYSQLQADAGVGIASGARLDALAGLLPTASASGSYSNSDQSSSFTVTSINGVAVDQTALPTDSKSTSTGFGFSVQEDLSLPRWFNYRAARAALRASRHARAASAQDLAFAVRQQFYLVLRAQDLVTVQEEDLRLAGDEERRINSMFELGSVARADVLKARVRFSDAEVALIQQQNQVEIEKARFSTLLGFSPQARLDLAGNLSVAGAPIDSARAAEEALIRPSLLRANADLDAASNDSKAASTSRLPALFAGFDFRSSDGSSEREQIQLDDDGNLFSFNSEADTESDGWTLTVGASINLDAFLNSGTAKRAASARRQAEYALEGTRLAVQQELEEAILNYRASMKAIEAAERGVESAQEDVRLSQERYQQGLGTVLELLEAQVNLTRARNQLVNALTGLKISEAAVDKARGAPLP